MLKRVLSAIVGVAILIVILLFGNQWVVNIAVTIIALIGLSEFYNVFKTKGYKPIESVGYILTLRNIRNRSC